ncbi:MAG: DNA polymerase III subunit beta [Muribaculaceae bacterium]|nr:DNA polymerase III subunit beta [Muribaculaceae bacterium]HAP50275.1 DNA polymerase III subunit beta [Porphyromonadaceae bacterium]
MKFNIQSKLLLTRLNAVSKVVSSKNAYAILDNFLFELSGDRLVVTGSDMETRLTTHLEVQDAEGNGKFAVDVKRIINLLKEMPDTALRVDVNEETLEVTFNYVSGHSSMTALSGDDYPVKAASTGEVKQLAVPARDVAGGIAHTIFAVGTDDMHPQFMGVYWDIKPDMIIFVASDSHKLVRYKATRVAPGFESSFIMPSKPAAVLSSIVDKAGVEPVAVSLDESSATFETKDYSLSCRFVNGRYPKYDSVIPENNPYELSIDRATLLNAVRRVSVLASVGGLVKFQIGENSILLTTQDLDHATSAEETVACEYSGAPMTIGFKNMDIIEVLNNIDSETVVVKLLDPARAGIFLPSEQKEGEDLLVLQMPMMI